MAGRAGWLARVGWLAAFLGPPVVAAGVWRQYSVQHPVAAVVIGVVYEAGVAVAGFAAGVTGDLAARWRERLVDRLDWALRSRVSGFDGRYRGLVCAGPAFRGLEGPGDRGSLYPGAG